MAGRTGCMLFLVLIICASRARPQSSTLFEYLPGFNFTRAVTEYGYKSEQHTVITEDGYILTVFRLLPPKKCLGKIRKPPVLLMHGLLLSADSWIVAGPNIGLGYLITDLCFDLWIGNSRGNTYSRKHITLNPDKNVEFWNYSYTEFGKYDLPALIDYILEATGSDKLNYVGFSQGGSSFYVMCSERPLYCDKVNVTISLAPATRNAYTSTPILRTLVEFIRISMDHLLKHGIGKLFERGSIIQVIFEVFCQYEPRLCDLMKDQLGSINAPRANFTSERTIKDAYKTFPSGTSVKNIAHIGQLLQNFRFKKYDYGDEKNIKVYGASKPPSYDLSKVSAPVVIVYGLNDALVHPKDIVWLVKQLPNVLEVYQVANSMWNHEDFTYCKFVKDLLLPKIEEYLLKYSI